MSYFLQLKQYTMDLLFALIAIYQLSFFRETRLKQTGEYYGVCLLGFIGPLLTTTYPITSAPIFLFLLLSLWRSRANRETARFYFWPSFALLAGYLISAWIDVRPGLANTEMKLYWGEFLAHYDSLQSFLHHTARSWGRFFTLLFYVPFNDTRYPQLRLFSVGLKVFFMLFSVLGAFLALIGLAQKRSKVSWGLDAYFVLILGLTMGLYLLRALPIGATLGPNRINYFLLPTVAYFFLRAFHSFSELNVPWARRVAASVSISLILLGYSRGLQAAYSEAAGNNSWFPIPTYQALGKAVQTAYQEQAPILILREALPFHHVMAVKTHPSYQVDRELEVQLLESRDEICKLGHHPHKVVLVSALAAFQVIASPTCGGL